MPQFQYFATSPAGKQIRGTVEAATQAEVVGDLRKKSLTLVNIRQLSAAEIAKQTKPAGGGFTLFKKKIKLMERVLFTRQLATMISAGIPILECLEVLAEQTENLNFRKILTQVVEDVRTGSDLSAALEKHPIAFTRIYVAMCRAGEASGQLDIILTRLAEYLEQMAKLRREIVGAMTYPLVSLCLVIGITGFLMVGIIPKFQEIFVSLAIDLPTPTKILLGVSLFLEEWWWLISGAFGLAVVGLKFLTKTPQGERVWDAFILRVPIFGPLFRKVAISRFSRTFATLIQSGVPILAALEIVATTSGNRIVEEAVLNGCEAVKQGEPLAEPLSKFWVFPPMVVKMISIGEKSGALEQLLEKISEFYDQQVGAAVEALTSLIEPLLIALMGALVGGIVLAVFMPLLKIQEQLQK